MGHSEGASGIMSLIKVLGILTDKKIPTNLHYVSSGHVPIVSKRLTVVTETRDFEENAGMFASYVGFYRMSHPL